MQLTDKQLTLWKELGSGFSAPPQLCQQALHFYQHYKQAEHCPSEKVELVIKVAYFLAEKAQVLYDRDGRRLKSIAISANSVLRDHPKHEEFLYHLLQMVRTVAIPAEASHLEEEVATFSRQFSSALTFMTKLRSTLKRIKVSRKTQESSDYLEQVTRLIWLLFVDCRGDLQIGSDIIASTCLLGGVLSYYLIEKYQEEGIFSIYFQHDSQGCTLSNEPEELAAFLMNFLHIKDRSTYSNTYNRMMDYLQQLGNTIDMRKVFLQQNVAKNIYLVQKIYEKKVTDGRLDESTFLKGNAASNQPVRITPFGRKAPLAPKTTASLSHKILSFENWDEGQENRAFTQNSKKEEKGNMQFLSKLKFHPTPKAALIRATPMSEAMQNYNWLFGKIGHSCLSKQELSFIDETFQSSIVREQINESKKDHCQLAGGLWRQTLSRYEELSPRALLLISVYAVCHVLNAPTQDIRVPMEFLQLSEYEIWQALDQVINSFDRNMPLSLKVTLLNLEISFVSHRLWVDYDHVEHISNGIECQDSRLIRRVLHQGAYTLHSIAQRLEINEEILDTSFLIFQQALQSEGELLFEKMLEHPLVCSLYAAAKVKEYSLKFNEIMAASKDVLGLAAGPFEELFQTVKMEERRKNIIDYYNELFMPSVRQYLKQLRSGGVEASPCLLGHRVKELVTRQVSAMSSPQLASYFAYCESPMLKPRVLRDLSQSSNMNSSLGSTVKRTTTNYGLSDIEAKFGKLGSSSTLKQTRKVKH